MKFNNSKTGRGRKTCRFFEQLDSVLGTRDVITVNAVCTAGTNESVRSGGVENSPPNVDPTHPKKRRDINDINNALLAIQERQDETMECFVSHVEQMEESERKV